MKRAIEQAILNKVLIEFSYSGHPRLIEPHVLGINGGVLQVLGYQVGGSSNSGGIPEWRRFDLPKISELRVTAEMFLGKRTFPSGKHSSWDHQIIVVS
ncbi:MAG TPA: hypothetical protein VGK09_10240 [Rhodocyclaceae bacterium]|jgi:hypothetical protein